jgi:hypothetical protein
MYCSSNSFNQLLSHPPPSGECFHRRDGSRANSDSIISKYDLMENKTRKRINVITSKTIYLLASVVYFWKKLFWSRLTRGFSEYRLQRSIRVVWVREWTIPTEQPPFFDEISAKFSRPEPLLFLPSSSSVVLTRLSGPRSRPTTSQKIWWDAGNRTRSSGSVARNSDH